MTTLDLRIEIESLLLQDVFNFPSVKSKVSKANERHDVRSMYAHGVGQPALHKWQNRSANDHHN